MHKNARIPVLAPDGTPLMPTKYSRACKWVDEGRAKFVSNDLEIKAVQLFDEPSGRAVQSIVLGVDPGKLYTGMAVASRHATLLLLHLALPFEKVKARKATQRLLRRARRGRRINRKLPFHQRAHHQERFSNRRAKKLPSSVRANKEMEKRIIAEAFQLFPITAIGWELVRAKVSLPSEGKSFSPVMTGQAQMLTWMQSFAPVYKIRGWQTKRTRERLKLNKSVNKKSQIPAAHANDALAVAAAYFVRYAPLGAGRDWIGSIRLTSSPFRVVTRPQIYRRQLHFENPLKKRDRRRKGGTITPWGFRSGDYVQAEKAGQVYRGWIGGFSDTAKKKRLSIYDHNWRRIDQFSFGKVKLVRRSNGLCLA